MGLTLVSEGRRIGVEATEHPYDAVLRHAEMAPPRAQLRSVGRLLGPETAVAAPVVGRADGAASRVRHGPEARRPVRDHDADGSTPLAFHADAVRRRVRRAPVEKGADDLKELMLVDGAAVQIE